MAFWSMEWTTKWPQTGSLFSLRNSMILGTQCLLLARCMLGSNSNSRRLGKQEFVLVDPGVVSISATIACGIVSSLVLLVMEVGRHQLADTFCLLGHLVPLSWSSSLEGINMWYKDLHTCCAVLWIHQHASTPDFLVSHLPIFFLLGPWPAGQTICHGVSIYSNLGPFIFSHKIDDQIYHWRLYPGGGVFLTTVTTSTPKWGSRLALVYQAYIFVN